MLAKKLLGAAKSAVVDAYYNLVTLLLPGNGTNGAQNNTFLDSSTNNFTITRNGNTTQGTFSPFSQTGWGNYFDGTGDYLSLSNDAAFKPGASTNPFCIECWIYPTSIGSDRGVFGNYKVISYPTNTDGFDLVFTSTGSLGFRWGYPDYADSGNPSPMSINTWNHFAVCRNSSGRMSFYLNGTRWNTVTTNTNITDSTASNFWIGWAGSLSGATIDPFPGYISNFRFVKGSSVYDPTQTTITVPTAPLTAITDTSLLTCQSNRFIDNSTNAFAITRNGDVSVRAFSPFAPTTAYSASTVGGSGYFDGTGDYLGCGTQTAYSFGTGTFTVEAWVYVTSRASEYNIASTRGSAGTVNGWSFAVSTSGGLVLYSNNWIFNSVGTVPLNAWTHVAVTREGTGSNQTKAYINGVNVASATNSENFTNTTLAIGSANDGSQFSFLGYISGFRMLKGTALTSFTLTSPPTNIANTSILTNFTNAGITDATAKNDLETVGGAQISTAQSKFGGSSMYFDGTGDWLLLPASPNNYLTGDLTVEFWVYPNNISNNPIVLGFNNTTIYDWVQFNNNIQMGVGTNSTMLVSTSAGNTVPLNTWSHVALTRNGSTWKIFINGVSQVITVTGTATSAWGSTTVPMRVGSGVYLTTDYSLNGYIDDLRVTKGFARYTANFTAPTAPFALQ
jgi:hypothetical protein